jgi:hypothetical protein
MSRKILKKVSIIFYYINLIDIKPARKFSDASTFCSINTKDMEEKKLITTTDPISNLKINNSFNFSSAINILRLNKLIYLDSEDILKYRNKYKSLDKFNAKEEKIIVNKFEVNYQNRKNIDCAKNKPQCNIKNNNVSNLVNTVPKSNDKKNNISKQKQKKRLKLKALSNKKKSEIYSQNLDISLMKEKPPKVNEFFQHDYSFNEKPTEKSNETFGKLNKETIPVAFYNHLMINDKKEKTLNNKHKYFRTSTTQRNKKKLLTIIYYSP